MERRGLADGQLKFSSAHLYPADETIPIKMPHTRTQCGRRRSTGKGGEGAFSLLEPRTDLFFVFRAVKRAEEKKEMTKDHPISIWDKQPSLPLIACTAADKPFSLSNVLMVRRYC